MIEPGGIDLQPEFRPLVVKSSNLMIAAGAHRSKGEIFDAAVASADAGRALVELGAKLFAAGHVVESVEDYLNAAAAFLEAGDHARANAALAALRGRDELREVAAREPDLSEKLDELSQRSLALSESYEQAWAELRKQMGTPEGAHKLRQEWLDKRLNEFPGLAALHWFASQKASYEYRRDPGNTVMLDRAIEHMRWASRFSPEDWIFGLLLIGLLLNAKGWSEAQHCALETLERAPDNPYVHWFAGKAILESVRHRRADAKNLDDAISHLRQGIRLGEALRRDYLFTMHLLIAACLHEKGDAEQSDRVMKQAATDYPEIGAPWASKICDSNVGVAHKAQSHAANSILAEASQSFWDGRSRAA